MKLLNSSFFVDKGTGRNRLKFVAISDTHSRHRLLKLPKGDVILHAGDISYRGKKSEVEDFLQWFSSLDYKYKIFTGGNHDFFLEKADPAELAAMIPANVIYLCNNEVIIDDIRIWGSPITPWFFNWAFNEKRGTPISKYWKMIPAGTDIVMTHGPVYGILDTVINGRNVGCQDLYNRIFQVMPKVHLCGHIHEGYGWVKRMGIRFINASLQNEMYEMVNLPVVFELEPGGTVKNLRFG